MAIYHGKNLIILGAALFFLSSCRVGPTYRPPEPFAPPAWKHGDNSGEKPHCDGCWWSVFDDAKLNTLEDIALENNNDLYIAMDRVVQARAQTGIVGSGLYPQIYLTPQYNNQGVLEKIFTTNPANPPPKKFIREHQLTYSLPFTLSWELDLWGFIYDQYASAVFNFQAQQYAYCATLLLLTADVADTYYRIRTLDTLIELYRETISTRKKAFQINQDRYDYKVIDYQPVALAGLDLSNVESQYYAAIKQRETLANGLAILLGLPPAMFDLPFHPLDKVPPQVPSGIPSDIIQQRPDIAQAERTMASQHMLIKAAYASLFPSFTLTGALGYLSPDYKLFLEWISRYWQIGVNVSQPIYAGGLFEAEIQLSWANFQQASDEYQQTVLQAFREVEDALTSLEWLVKEEESVQHSVDYAQTAYKISMDRYLKGVDFYLQVADNERQLLDNERVLVNLKGERFLSTIQLIKALGGCW